MREADFWRKTEKGIECFLCPHTCKLDDGQWGLCGARKNEDGILRPKSYGRPNSLQIDPIEKKPLKNFLPGTKTLSFGCRGCNLFCPFCQNHTISRKRPEDSQQIMMPLEILEKAVQLGLPSVSYTYNEPGTFFEYLFDTASLIKGRGIKNIMVTNGYLNAGPWDKLLDVVDAMNIDVKSADEEAFKRTCGGDLGIVYANVESAIDRGCHVEITCLMVPGLCGIDSVTNVAKWLGKLDKDIPMHITRYFPFNGQGEQTPVADMKKAQAFAQTSLNYVYLGNV